MRICVIGSHGTGKSTLCKELSRELRLNYIPDVVPHAHRLKFEINETTPPETQLWILSKQIELERNTDPPWVSEKALWDNFIYGQFSIRQKYILRTIKRVSLMNATYDHVFYLPIEFAIENDGLRSLDVVFQKKIDTLYRDFLDEVQVSYTTLRGSIENRVSSALAQIK